jgi:hypothetical protein
MVILIFQKGKELCSLTDYSKNRFFKADRITPVVFSPFGKKLISNGWKVVAKVTGWNCSVQGLISGTQVNRREMSRSEYRAFV